MPEYRDSLDHILLPNWGQTKRYKFPHRVNDGIRIPPRQRAQHAAHLKAQIDSIKTVMRMQATFVPVSVKSGSII